MSYYCPRCGAVAELDRDPDLADKSVTPFPLEGWMYVSPADEYESEDASGVKFVCGRDAAEWSHPPRGAEPGEASTGGAGSDATRDEPGCGEPFYLNFVRYEDRESSKTTQADGGAVDGEEVSGQPESEYVQLAEGMGPGGPRGPSGPGFSR